MPTIPEVVRPGDIISSDLLNRMISLINDHDARLGGTVGGKAVPDLFGRTFAEASVMLQLQELALGSVVDTFGTIINTSAGGAGSRIVLNQVPAAGARTMTGAAVHLVVAAQPGSSPPAPTPPQVNAVVPNRQHALGDIEIRGSGFISGATVTFDGILGTVLPTSTQGRLIVRVPQGIPGAPTAPGAPDRTGVPIVVTNPNGASTTATTTFAIAPPPTNPVTITDIDPDPATVNQSVTIKGTGFSTTPNQNEVQFGTRQGTVTAATAAELTVTVPTGIPGLVMSGDSTTVNVTVRRTTDNVISASWPLHVDL